MVWIGRREGVDEVRSAAEAVEALGELGPGHPDMCGRMRPERSLCRQPRRQIKGWFGRIDGLVHAAISLLDKSLGQMQEESSSAPA